MLAASTMSAPIFNLDFSSYEQPSLPSFASTKNQRQRNRTHQPSVASPLSSSPLRQSQSTNCSLSSPPPAPLSQRDPNSLFRPRESQSSPIKPDGNSKLFKFASRPTKPNPLRHSSRESAQEGRRRLFLDNVRQKRQEQAWERRGGDQEALKMEWSLLSRRLREQRDADLDGLVYEDELEDIPEEEGWHYPADSYDDMMADAVAREEEQELDAMISMLQPQNQQQLSAAPFSWNSAAQQKHPHAATPEADSSFLSDDEDYDNLFMDMISSPEDPNDICSSQMDLS